MTELRGPEPELQIRNLADDIAREAVLVGDIWPSNDYRCVLARDLADKAEELRGWVCR